MTKSTATSCIKQAMEKGGGTVRDIHARLIADPKMKKLLGGKTVPVQTVATALHKGDIKRNPRGWCKSEAGRPLRYTLTGTTAVPHQPSTTTPDANPLEPLVMALLPVVAGAMLTGLQIMTVRSNQAPGTVNLVDILGAAAKNFTFPLASNTEQVRVQKRARA